VVNGIGSITGFLYSCRETVDSPFPELTSETAVKCLELLKRIKNEIGSDEIFSNIVDYATMKIFDGGALFIKFYYMPGFIDEHSPYIISNMPGIKKGISGTILVGYNIGIINTIDEKKLLPAIEAIKFMTSKEMQKDLVLKESIVSGMTSLYNEEEICNNIQFCDFYKNPQLTLKPKNVFNSDEYYERFLSYFYDFLFRNESASKALKKIDDLNKIYHISINTKEISNYIPKFMIQEILILAIALLNFITLFISRLFLSIFVEEDENSKLFENFSLTTAQTMIMENSINISEANKDKNRKVSAINNLFLKILEYHKRNYTFTETVIINTTNNNNNISEHISKTISIG
ncbi:hypothetical protein PIROE2DRAFT_9843, partial [Piromyces sp. E2]